VFLLWLQGDYVLSDDEQLEKQKPVFDLITCMSVTKWMHLNHGDDGLKRAFKRMYAQLRPGGILILEPQSFASYKQKKAVTVSFFTSTFQLLLISDFCVSVHNASELLQD
jgi:7SK snRNA methylphosphate capping enzyme